MKIDLSSQNSEVRSQKGAGKTGAACGVLRELRESNVQCPESKVGEKFPVIPGVSTYFLIIPDNGRKNASAWAGFNREKDERCERTQMRGIKMESRKRKLFARTILGIRSPAFCLTLPRQNVRLSFASRSPLVRIKIIFFL